MAKENISINKRQFFLRIILPSVLTIGLFVVFNFGFIIPYFEVNQMNNKKQMIREIVFSSICIADELAKEVENGEISLEEAQAKAAQSIGSMRYGVENKDYLWITDLRPVMIRHPYRPELNGQDLSGFTDAHGKKMFVEFVEQSRETGEAYVDYMWQWMDDPTRIVPKISFVMEYKPWRWLIGTGVYLEDIRNEIAGMKRVFVFASLAIFALMTAMLTIIVRRNLRVETQRSIAEQNLKESRERYRTLVEASTDGTLLFMDGRFIYANKKIKDFLKEIDLASLGSDLSGIIQSGRKDDIDRIREFLQDPKGNLQFETILSVPGYEEREVMITISEVTFSDKNGFIYVIKDLVRPKAVETESALAQLAPAVGASSSMGIFTASLRGKGRFTAFSPVLPELLGFSSADELKKISILDLIENHSERKEFAGYLAKYRKLDGYQLVFRKPSGDHVYLLIYATLVADEVTGSERISGIFLDNGHLQGRYRHEVKMNEAMTALYAVLNGEIRNFMQPPVWCSPSATTNEILGLMEFYASPVVCVKNQEDSVIGAVSAKELLPAYVKHNRPNGVTAAQIMNPSPAWCSGECSVAEVLERLENKNIHYLLIGSPVAGVEGLITKELLAGLFSKTDFLTGEEGIKTGSIGALTEWHRKLPFEVKILLDAGAKPQVITNLVTRRSDKITHILAEKVLQELGPPPARFALIALGSEARREQTLLTDQDNALIYDDSVAGDQQVAAYFLRFGKRMNELLNQVGYELCKGEIMAGNPRWNQPLSTWKKYFASWIAEANPQNLVDISVFFDYRTVFGDQALTDELRSAIHTLLDNTPAFFGFMAMANLNYKIPLNIFGRLQPETSDDSAGTINIKNAARVMVNIIRLYAVKNRIEENNTLERIRVLHSLNVFSYQLITDLNYAWEFLLLTQFRHQVFASVNRLQMDHNINLSMLSTIEINTLKTIFTTLTTFQNRLKNDFGVSV